MTTLSIAVALVLSLQPSGIFGAELDTPKAYSFVTNVYPALSKQVFYITVTQIKPEVEPDCVTDDLGWESVAFICLHRPIIQFRELTCQYPIFLFLRYSSEGFRAGRLHEIPGIYIWTGLPIAADS